MILGVNADPHAQAQKAEELFNRGRFAEAYPLFLSLAKAHPAVDQYRLRLGEICLKQGRKDDALRIFKHLAAVLTEKGQVAAAVAIGKRVAEIAPNDREIQKNLEGVYAQPVDDINAESPAPGDHWKKAQAQARERVSRSARAKLEVTNASMDLAGPRDRVTLSAEEMAGRPGSRDIDSNISASGLELADDGDLSDRSIGAADGYANVSFREKSLTDLSVAGMEAPREYPRIPLFSDLPAGAFEKVVDRFKRLTYPPNTVILRQGDPGESIFVVAVGQVRVVREVKGADHELALLGPGDFFGEFAYFSRTSRGASIIAVGIVELLELTRESLQEIIMENPKVERALFNFYKQRVLSNLLSESPLFSPITPEDRAHLIALFNWKTFNAGEYVFREGDPPDDFYVVQSGQVEVTKKGAAAALATLGPGEFFGEYAMITNAPRSASIRALEKTILAVLTREGLKQLLQGRPAVAEVLKRVAKDRMAANLAKHS